MPLGADAEDFRRPLRYEFWSPIHRCLNRQRRDGERTFQGDRHPFAGEGFDITRRVADHEQTFVGQLGRVLGEGPRAAQFRILEEGAPRNPGLTQNLGQHLLRRSRRQHRAIDRRRHAHLLILGATAPT